MDFALNDEQLLRYSRHILLAEIGVEGQEKLRASHALIIGAGGLGCPAALYLASSGVGRLTLADSDQVDLTIPSLPFGRHSLRASYEGNATFEASDSDPITYNVLPSGPLVITVRLDGRGGLRTEVPHHPEGIDLDLPLGGAKRLEIVVEEPGQRTGQSWVHIADARLQ